MSNYTEPARGAIAITPSDSTDLSVIVRGLFIGGTGNLTVNMSGGSVTFYNVQQGTVLPIRVTRVFATGTTATNILGLY